jgi:DNA-binding winged helix-turn-helix (wHTH) protein/tetratricopeptide (TPR) repeat protein
LIYTFDDHSLDTDRRELRRGSFAITIEPQVFDLLQYLIENRDRVVGKDEVLRAIWKGRIVSESTLSSRIAALRRAVGDSGEGQRLVRTIARKGFRFVGDVHEQPPHEARRAAGAMHATISDAPPITAAAESTESNGFRPAPERRQLTIAACRIGGIDRLDPEDVRQVLAACHATISRIASLHRGFAGRSTANVSLIHFGYPAASEQDAERAVRAGLDIVAAIGASQSDPESSVHAQIGIDTGLVVIANVAGVSGEAGLDFSGQAVHRAMRLVETAPQSAVVITDATRRLIGKLFTLRSMGTAAAGDSSADRPADTWEVLREQPIADRFEALRAAPAPLIGRDEEIALLRRRWEQIGSGEGRVVLIWGEAGIGKSHLVAGLQDAIGAQRHAVLRFFCSPHRVDTALHPIVTYIEDASELRSGDDDSAKRRKLAQLLAQSAEPDERDVPLFAELLGIAVEGRSPATALSAPRRKELLLERFAALMAGLARAAPLLIVLEDAHWIDPTTRELFDLLVDRVRTMRTLLVMTYRPEFSPPWLGQAHVTTLTLTRLDRPSNLALVRRVAGGHPLPPDVVDEILAKADGVPLFVEEVTKSVLESGSVRESGGRYIRSEPQGAISVPATLQASLVARIDRLSAIRPLVQTCAALGREFGYRLLRSVTALADAELEPAMEQFVGSGLVHQRGSPPDARYAFKHALVQDAAYETMVRSQRTEIHRRIADVLQHEFPDIPARNPDMLAHHCSAGGLWEQAIEFSIAAARMAVERSAGVEAEACVERAIALLPKVGQDAVRARLEGRLRVAHADALIMTQGFASPHVNDALTQARALLRPRDDPEASLRALCGLFNYHLIRSESPSCLALVAPLATERLARPRANVVQYLAGTANLHLGNFDATIHHLEAARALYDDDACRDVAFVAGYHLHSFTLIWLGLAYLYVGAFDNAAATILAAVDDARRRAHPFTLVSALLAEARYRSHRHDLPAAVAATEEGFAIATEQRSPYHVSRASILRAVNALDGGEARQAIGLMEAALVAHRATGANFQSSYNLTRLAEAYALAGRHDEALRLADAAIAEVKRCGERWWEAEAERLRGEILLLADPRNHAAAERCFAKSRATAKRQRARLWEINAVHSLAALWKARGRDSDARDVLASVQ